ncbi:MAG: T9SS type A sorting domain-containing protein [Saprospiraceae bacterium]|nr:T9SS type A sorting domain-containing protein [Saprospiraceae bacterium]
MVLILFSLNLDAQDKRDYQWVIGYDTSLLDPGGDAVLLDFRENPRYISHIKTVHKFLMEGSNTSMSDVDGNLLFYSNGCYIVNAKHEIMLNGDSINPGLIEDIYCSSGGSPLIQGVIAIPSPEGDSLYYVFNLDFDEPYQSDTNFLALAPQRLFYQKIDMTQDSGLGAVVLKNQIAVFDTFARGNIQAVRHANGEDWWVIVPKSHSNCYFLLPITSEGIQPAQVKCMGNVWDDRDIATQVTFTPDGKKYIRFNAWNGLNIFDFDAATGDLSNARNIMFPNDTINYILGAAISPNSRFLYICARKNIYQFDLQAPDIESSKMKIATWDGYQNPYPTIFYLAALAPDGKIYISNTSSTYNLHVINKPNCLGLSCELVQHGIVLPSYNFATIPNMPHYRQSNFDCDSTLIGAAEASHLGQKLAVFPNPASEDIYISGEFAKGEISIYDATGRVVLPLASMVSDGQLSIRIQDLLPGFYFICLQKEGKVWSGKFVKR